MSKNISRRDFLKLTLTSLTAAFLAACGRALGIPATPAPTLAPTSTDTPAPTATNTLLPPPPRPPTHPPQPPSPASNC